jgi:hypothetical protein
MATYVSRTTVNAPGCRGGFTVHIATKRVAKRLGWGATTEPLDLVLERPRQRVGLPIHGRTRAQITEFYRSIGPGTHLIHVY